ncbi:MAG: undecaprenyl-phosphate glucose phosphotransferase [Candidatus Omnitrophica bacterium]|nr:undecaprenyl-phosphate glucose phosphotransferase [Candidatus Omnitrophota bacterium]
MKPRHVIVRQMVWAISDAAMVTVGFLAAYVLRFHSGWIPLRHEVPPLTWYTQPLAVVVLVYLLFFRSVGLYAMSRARYLRTDAGTVLHGTTLASVTLMALSFLYRDASYSRVVGAMAWAFITTLVLVGRAGISRGLARLQPTPRLLIIGAGPTAARLVHHLQGQGGYHIIGAIPAPGAEASDTLALGVPILGQWDRLPSWIGRHAADEVIVAEPALSRTQIMSLINQCEQALVNFRMVPDTLELLTTQRGTDQLDGIPLLGLRQSPLVDPWNRCLKRSMDLVAAALGVLITAPWWLIIAAAIRRDSPGPVFYVQKRIGEDGRSFTMIKFRTMRTGAETQTGPVWTTPDDGRRTRIGRWLRRWNLDELPQLLNVLRGEMSLVGPRPERPHFVRQFKQDIPRYMARHRIRSGITGWAQIHGLRGDTSIETRTQYDLYYLENWSLWLDCKILWQSLTAVRNAY